MAKDPSEGGQSSMLQGLQRILGDLGALMAAPDGDVQFLTQLQHAIVGKIKQSTMHAISPQQQGAGPGGGMGGGMRGFGDAGQQAAQGMGPQQQPNPDEMRRVMGATGTTG